MGSEMCIRDRVVLGSLYSRDDTRRDGGFSIFYMGVNIGALFGPLITTIIWGWKGFHWGFGLAAIGMFAGLIQYTLMRKSTIKDAGHEVPNPASSKQMLLGLAAVLGIVAIAVISIATGVVKVDWLSNIVTVVALLAAICLLYTSPSPRDLSTSRMPSSA